MIFLNSFLFFVNIFKNDNIYIHMSNNIISFIKANKIGEYGKTLFISF